MMDTIVTFIMLALAAWAWVTYIRMVREDNRG